MTDRAISMLLRGIDEAYDKRAWHGPNLRGALRGITAKDALRRPGKGRHNIWELAIHAAYWKYAARQRIVSGARGSFPLKGSNWIASPASLDEAGWKAALKLLETEHRKLREAVAALDPEKLNELVPSKRYNYAWMIRGVAAHDLYHAGQIQLVKKL
ncbi:MAG TPA: DinB family protein [Thermoanaerobaculia bacterium]|nr:DinB family protein [Thermoanaerobaculia bacterium]